MKTSIPVYFVYLTAFTLPENGWLWVSSGFTLEGDSSANANHLVPWSYHKCRGHWRTAMRMVSHWIDKHAIVCYSMNHNITVRCSLDYLNKRQKNFDYSCSACVRRNQAHFQNFAWCVHSRLNSTLIKFKMQDIMDVMNRKNKGYYPAPSFAWARARAIKIYMEMGNKFEPSVHADTLQ